MKFLIALALVTFVAARPDDHYDSKYDDLNVDEIIGNDRLLTAYAHCFIGDGKCTPEGTEIKKWVPEATSSSCGKCTEKQKALVAKTIKAIKEKLPKEYTALISQSDPDGKYTADLEAFIAKYSV